MEYVTLENGVKMPQLGFGVYQVGNEETETAVGEALRAGYRLIDTAQAYGNEEGVGRAIAKSGIPREELFITTKLWLTDVNFNAAKIALDTSLEKLGLDYVDLYLIHQPYNDVFGAWRAMREALEEGKIRAIGVSNFDVAQLTNLAEFSGVKPAVNQIEVNPFHAREKEVAYYQEYGVQTESWAPFAEGRNGLFTNPVLEEIGKAHGKSVAQVVLRWILQRGIVVIPKSVHPERMAQNIDVFDFELTDAEMEKIRSLDKGESQFFSHHDPERIKMFASGGRWKSDE